MQKKQITYILIDGSSYLFRAYHALPPFSNKEGFPTGAMYGVINMLKKLIADYEPEYVGMVFDTKSKNFRHELYPEYKANRPEMPEELAVQIEPLHEIIEAMGVALIKREGYEADDIIGSLAAEIVEKGKSVLISTGDKDFAQLVGDNVTLVNTMNDFVFTRESVVEKFGVEPKHILDYLALVGDASDNIPGVPKVGPKTAVKWINLYGGIEEIKKHAEDIKGKVGENLRNNIEQLDLSYKLVTIKCDLELNIIIDDLKLENPDKDALLEFYKKYNFRTWLKELENSDDNLISEQEQVAVENTSTKLEYTTILDKSGLDKLIQEIEKTATFVVDLETTSLDYISAEIVGFAISTKECTANYIPVRHVNCFGEGENKKNVLADSQLNLEYVLEKLKPILENKNIVKIGHNLKYDINVLHKYNVHIENIEDTMLMSYVYNSTASRHNMDALANYYLQYDTISYEEVAGKGAKQICFSEVAIDIATSYAGEDADITYRLYNFFKESLTDDDLLKVYQGIELPLVPVLSAMELTGVAVDKDLLLTQSDDISSKISKIEQEIFIIAGEEFNIGSPKQLQVILFGKLNLPVLEKTPKGQPSTAESVLQELSHNFALPKLILEYRSLAKLKSTYTDKLPLQINEKTNRIHTSYHQAIAATGRLSSTDPNLQNIPIRTEEGRKIRQAFIAKPGYKIISSDYSQIELRILAHLSEDENLKKAFKEELDIHRFTAAQIFDVEINDVTTEQRRSAKAINFGLIYGMSAFGLAKSLGIQQSVAIEYMEEYFKRYPTVKDYMAEVKENASKLGYVKTIFSRRLYLPEIRSKNAIRRKAAERAAINAPMQGTNADIIKLSMTELYSWCKEQNGKIKMLMQVHDELVFEVEEGFVNEAIEQIKTIMEQTANLSVPLTVGINLGDNWDEAH